MAESGEVSSHLQNLFFSVLFAAGPPLHPAVGGLKPFLSDQDTFIISVLSLSWDPLIIFF